MARLRFNADMVKRLIDHATACAAHCATYEQAYAELGKDWFDGKVSSDVLRDKIPAALHFVKDDGIYLMSNGAPTQPGTEFGQSTKAAVVYANGYDPQADDVWNKARAAVGGDDFVEHIDISSLPKMPPGARFLEVNVSPKKFTVSWVAGMPPMTARPVSKKTKVN